MGAFGGDVPTLGRTVPHPARVVMVARDRDGRPVTLVWYDRGSGLGRVGVGGCASGREGTGTSGGTKGCDLGWTGSFVARTMRIGVIRNWEVSATSRTGVPVDFPWTLP